MNAILYPKLREYSERTSHSRWMSPDCATGLVTVIIPTYNRADLVTDAMDSVLQQDYRPIELIVVDDGSEDDTENVVRRWIETNLKENGFTARYFKQENNGAPAARNLGLIESNGEFIQFLDSDCELLRDKIADQVVALNGQPATSHCYCVTEFITTEGRRRYLIGQAPAKDSCLNVVMSTGFTSIAPLWRRSALYGVGPWDEDLICRQDWVYKSRVLLRYGTGSFIPIILCRAKLHKGDRISKHGTEVFATGVRIAVQKVAELLDGCDSDTRAAKNHLAKEMLAVFKVFLRVRRYRLAEEALYEAADFASGRFSLRIRAIQVLWSMLRPELFRRFVSAAGRV